MPNTESASKSRIVIVGGGYGGVLAALRIASKLRGRAEVTLIDGRDALVERVRLHELVARGRAITHPYAELLRGTEVRFVRGWVQGIDTARRRVMLDAEVLEYDRLLLTVGSSIARAAVPGMAEHALALDPDRIPDAQASLARAVERGGHVLVCGGGLTGIEMAAELAEAHHGLRVSLITSGELGAMVSAEGREYLRSALLGLAVQVREHVMIERVEAGLLRCEQGEFEFDACIWACGFEASPLLRAIGLQVDDRGQAWVDPYLRALDQPSLFVAGDAAAMLLPEDPTRTMPMGCKSAMPLAAHAADNLVASVRGRPLVPFDYADSVLCISLGRRDGLLQAMPGARPGRVLARGRLAAWIKERICRFTVKALAWQRIGIDYRWAKTGRPVSDRIVASEAVQGPAGSGDTTSDGGN
jgi:NADH dehydrogenase